MDATVCKIQGTGINVCGMRMTSIKTEKGVGTTEVTAEDGEVVADSLSSDHIAARKVASE